MKFATKAIHSAREHGAPGDVVPPIHLTSIYAQTAPGELIAGYEYIRYGNPTRAALEKSLGLLEAAPERCAALCFSSGQAATDCALRLLRPGDRLLMATDVYGGTMQIAEQILRPGGIEIVYFDAADAAAIAASLEPGARIVWIETPSNPLLRIADIESIAAAAHAAGAILAVDNTFATPCFQNPLLLGANIVMHSTTKYIGGHSDLLGGALVCREPELRERLFAIQKLTGGVAAPFDSWLTLRGLRTLEARMRIHEQNASVVAKYLSGHSAVRSVYYPGLASHPQHELAARQMRGFGGIVSFEVDGGFERACQVLQSTRLFALAGSLGGVESIISYPAKMSHAALTPDERRRRGIGDGLIRLSVGIEDAGDLIGDLARALA